MIRETMEWLEADGLGGFAMGTSNGLRTRRYHALLLAATTPPTGRMVLVNGLDAWVERPGRPPEYLSRQRYAPGAVAPSEGATLESFAAEPWPTWRWRLDDGSLVELELFVPHGLPLTALRWRRSGSDEPATLVVRPFLSGRDSHATHHENPVFRFDAEVVEQAVTWRPYEGVPGVTATGTGRYAHDPQWYRGFQYDEERARGLDAVEDLASPGLFRWSLSQDDAVLLLSVAGTLPADDLVAIARDLKAWPGNGMRFLDR